MLCDKVQGIRLENAYKCTVRPTVLLPFLLCFGTVFSGFGVPDRSGLTDSWAGHYVRTIGEVNFLNRISNGTWYRGNKYRRLTYVLNLQSQPNGCFTFSVTGSQKQKNLAIFFVTPLRKKKRNETIEQKEQAFFDPVSTDTGTLRNTHPQGSSISPVETQQSGFNSIIRYHHRFV
jgi:hypothetical protein